MTMTPALNERGDIVFLGRRLRRDIVAIASVPVSVGLIVLVKLLFDPIIGHGAPSLLFTVAIVIATLFGGRNAGIAAALLSAVLIETLFQSTSSEGVAEGYSDELVRALFFLGQEIVIVFVVSARLKLEEQLGSERAAKSAIEKHSIELARRNEQQQRTQLLLNEANARLMRSNRDLEEFAVIASHDLQEPLRKVHGFIDIIVRRHSGSLSDESRLYIGKVQGATARMQRLIDDLLTLSRVNTRASPFVQINLNDVARDVMQDLDSRIREAGAAITIDPLPTIVADRTQMHQLFQNLVSNAIKFRRPDVEPIVHITSEETVIDRNGLLVPGVRITVGDNGIGFDERYLDRIFKIFQRLHGREEYDGTGIGLSICQRIVTRHNGSITATSAPGGGAAFIITLPTAQTIEDNH